MSGTSGLEGVGDGADDLAALRQLAMYDVGASRAARIRGACHTGLRALPRQHADASLRGPSQMWSALEPVFASALGALYLLAVLQRAVLLLAG